MNNVVIHVVLYAPYLKMFVGHRDQRRMQSNYECLSLFGVVKIVYVTPTRIGETKQKQDKGKEERWLWE